MNEIDALRQQLADVSNERDAAVVLIRAEREKTAALQLRLNASEARNSVGGNTGDAVTAFNERHYGYEFPSEDLRHGALNLFCAGWFERHKLAQSAPATCQRCRASTTDICNQNGCGYLESGNGAPATDEQGAGA